LDLVGLRCRVDGVDARRFNVKQITEDSNGTEIDLAAGETLEVRLEENRSTGFKWVLESAGGGACALAGDTFEKGTAIGEP
jgi:predicted secreted protein